MDFEEEKKLKKSLCYKFSHEAAEEVMRKQA